jgi:hypothetical protein
MTTLTLHTNIATDGKLRLEVPTDLPAGPVEVVVIVQPRLPAPAAGRSLLGAFAGKLSDNIDVVEEIRQIRRQATREAMEVPE